MKNRKLFRLFAAGLSLAMCLSSVAIVNVVSAEPLPAVGNQYLQENLEKFPAMFDYEKNQTKAAFSNADDRVVQEVVWIETPLDTDLDRQRDLMRVRIRRPIETLPENGGLKTPVIAALSPYQTSMSRPSFAAFGGRIDEGFLDQGPAATQFTNARFSDGQVIKGPENDVSYAALRSVTERRVGKGPDAHVARYKDLLADGMLKATTYTEQQKKDYPWLPVARTPNGHRLNGIPFTASGNAGAWSAATFIPLGYSFVYVDILGNDYAQGILQYGAYEESLCAAAVVDWLNGRIRAYTDQSGEIEVEAYWATGDMAASGTSYGGTLPMAAAVTGVEGLRTIIPGAPVTNAYNYYRENGIAYAPGGWQGEDITSTTYYCFGRGWNLNSVVHPTPKVWDTWWNWELYLLNGRDALTGDYNPFWDERNPLSFADDMRTDIGVIMGHGFNDNNVKFRHTALLNETLKYYGVEAVKGVFGQAGHALNTNRAGSWVTGDNLIQWTDHFLYGVENGIVERMPNYIVENNIGTAQWTERETWPAYTKYQKFYPAGDRVGVLSTRPQMVETDLAFKDTLVPLLPRPVHDYEAMAQTIANTESRKHILVNGVDNQNGWLKNALIHQGQASELATTDYSKWRNWIVGGLDATTAWSGNGRLNSSSAALTANLDITKAIEDRLLFTADIQENFTISGTVAMTAEVAANKNVGAISAMLLEWGPTVKMVAMGSVDVRNPNPDGTLTMDVPAFANIEKGGNWHPNYLFQSADIVPYGTEAPKAENFNSYTFEMDITEYNFTAGNKLGLVIFGSDPVFTYRPTDATEFTVKLGPDTFVSLPVIGTPVVVSPDITLKADKAVILKDQYVTINAALTSQAEANVVVLDYKFDKDKFEFAGYEAPAGGTLISREFTEDSARIMFMVGDYAMKDLGNIMLRAKENIIEKIDLISLVANLVVKDGADKKVVTYSSDLCWNPKDDPEYVEFDLIYLSNVIDAFGAAKGDANWIDVKRYDWNLDGKIDITDVTYAAQRITLE